MKPNQDENGPVRPTQGHHVPGHHVEAAWRRGLACGRAWGIRAWAAGTLACLVLPTVSAQTPGYWFAHHLPASPGTVFEVVESTGTVQVKVRRVGFRDIATTVGYRAVDVTAKAGEDYEVVEGVLEFPAGVEEQTISVLILNDPRKEGTGTFRLHLTNASGGVPIADTPLTIRISDTGSLPARVDPGFNPVSVVGGLSWPVVSNGQAVPQSAGGLLTAVEAEYLRLPGPMAMVRLLADGAIDPNFQPFPGVEGWSATPEGVCHVLTSDGRIHSLSPTGQPDPTFSHTGPAHWIHAVLSRAEGGAWIVTSDERGYSRPHRLRADGKPDPAFVGPSFSSDVFRGLVATPAGGVALMGRGLTTDKGDKLMGFAVCGADGTLIRHEAQSSLAALVVQAVALHDGRFLAVGYLPEFESFAFFRATASGSVDPTLPPMLGTSVTATAGGKVWLLRTDNVTSLTGNGDAVTEALGRIERRLWDGAPDPSWSPQAVEIDLQPAWRYVPRNGVAGGGAGCDWCVINAAWNFYWNDDLPTLSGDGQGALYLRSVARVNGQLRRGIARLDVEAPTDRLELSPEDARLGENAGATTVTLFRGGDVAAAASYRWQTADGSARAGIDYQAGSGVVEFPAGSRVAILPLVLIDNHDLDTDRTVRIEFTEAAGRRLPPAIVTVVNEDLGFLPGGLAASTNLPWFLRPTGHLVRRGHPGGAIVVSSPALSTLRRGQWVGWANAFVPETLIPPVQGPVNLLSLEQRTGFGMW